MAKKTEATKIGVMTAMEGSLRAICEEVNKTGILREDVVSLLPKTSDGTYILVYYYYEREV